MVKVTKVETIRTLAQSIRLALFVGLVISGLGLFAAGIVLDLPLVAFSMLPVFGAVTPSAVAAITGGSLIRRFTLEATADADVDSGLINHGFVNSAGVAAAPDQVILTPLLAQGALKAWAVTTLSATQIRLTGNNVVGSGVAGASLQVTMIAYHSAIR